jgi:hypothetical protein
MTARAMVPAKSAVGVLPVPKDQVAPEFPERLEALVSRAMVAVGLATNLAAWAAQAG